MLYTIKAAILVSIISASILLPLLPSGSFSLSSHLLLQFKNVSIFSSNQLTLASFQSSPSFFSLSSVRELEAIRDNLMLKTSTIETADNYLTSPNPDTLIFQTRSSKHQDAKNLTNNQQKQEFNTVNNENLLPPAIDDNFIRRVANECPAVTKDELINILHTAWKVCKEEKFHFMRTLAQIRAESDFNPTLVSRAGATGLMQIMPGTAKFMKFKSVESIEDNIRCGVKYMKFVERYVLHSETREHWLASLASYNSGPGHYTEMARRANKRYGSTKWNYVAKTYRRRFRRARGQKLPETLIYINRNLYSLGRFQENLFEASPLANADLGSKVRIPPMGRTISGAD